MGDYLGAANETRNAGKNQRGNYDRDTVPRYWYVGRVSGILGYAMITGETTIAELGTWLEAKGLTLATEHASVTWAAFLYRTKHGHETGQWIGMGDSLSKAIIQAVSAFEREP